MKTITRIQVEFGEPATPLQIQVRLSAATASRLRSAALVDSNAQSGNISKDATANNWSAEAEQFIDRIREVLQKRGAR